jgi:hypothetical protein
MTKPLNKLFVYGIFLSERQRAAYGMSNPQYATVLDYATFGGGIVTAYKQADIGLSLTGLLVDVAPYEMREHGMRDNWKALDALEYGYERILITTTDGVKAYMYAGKE